MADFAKVRQIFSSLRKELGKVIIGQNEVIDLILAALLARGHVLLEGVPGTAKTLIVKSLAKLTGLSFQRIQMTPDLMPSDVLGTTIFNERAGNFQFHKGPIFCDLGLVDEINRAPAKTQSALLECMEERQVTIEGNRFLLSQVFMVLATQNPLEYEGTYPLPEAQLDRFLFKILIDYPSAEEEIAILERYEEGFRADRLDDVGLQSVTTIEELMSCQEMLKEVQMKQPVMGYITSIVRMTRNWNNLMVGGGIRADIALFLAGKARALMEGREFATPDDVKFMTLPVLRHRVILKPEAEIEGITPDRVIQDILNQVKVPR